MVSKISKHWFVNKKILFAAMSVTLLSLFILVLFPELISVSILIGSIYCIVKNYEQAKNRILEVFLMVMFTLGGISFLILFWVFNAGPVTLICIPFSVGIISSLIFIKLEENSSVKGNRSFIANTSLPNNVKERFIQKYGVSNIEYKYIEKALLGYMSLFASKSKEERVYFAMPSSLADELWHIFILFTKEYADFCKDTYGKFLHHNPHTSANEQMESIKYMVNTYIGLKDVDLSIFEIDYKYSHLLENNSLKNRVSIEQIESFIKKDRSKTKNDSKTIPYYKPSKKKNSDGGNSTIATGGVLDAPIGGELSGSTSDGGSSGGDGVGCGGGGCGGG